MRARTAELSTLVLTIGNGRRQRVYRVERLPDEAGVVIAWRLVRLWPGKKVEVYDVHFDRHGPACTCPDWVFRKNNTPDVCKHIEAMTRATLLPPRST